MTELLDKTRQLITTEDDAIYDFYAVYDADGRITEAELKRSKLHQGWTKPGSSAIKINDDGNKIMVQIDGNRKVKLEYHEVCELFIVLNEYMKSGKEGIKGDYEKFVREDSI